MSISMLSHRSRMSLTNGMIGPSLKCRELRLDGLSPRALVRY